MSDDRFWYKDAVFYELRVRSFCDSDGDGIGDLRGLAQKLDYLADLGVTTLWLLPFYPSPLRDDGYDIADYTTVHQVTGTLRDFKNVLKEAHRRGLRVVTELVINHTSDQHPWFQRARRSPAGSRFRDFYVWSDDPSRYSQARIIFQDFETSNWSWDPLAQAYFWHRFYSHQPDLNFENPEVQRAVLDVCDHWFEMGVDGMRLDAVPYLYEREGTNCENLPETHAFLKQLRAHVDRKWKNRMLLAEANQWPEDAVAYFGNGDECHMSFHFPIMPRLFMSLRMEDRYPIIDILEQTPPIAENCQWAIFLRNHDELTLEMVTDEERDYMVSTYASERAARINLGIRRRLAPLLENNRRRIELMNALLFSLPGTPVLYYGDEIGMGDNVYLGDRDGVRTPMQWSPDRNAGFSRANPQRLILPLIVDPEYHYEAINVETQQSNPSSLLWWMKRLIGLRKQFLALGRGSLEMLHPTNRKVLAFLRRHQDEAVLVVANLSRFAQYVELELSEFRSFAPVELFGNIEFPPIADRPYLLTLGPHNFFWFSLQRAAKSGASAGPSDAELPAFEVSTDWDELLRARGKPLEKLLAAHLVTRRWFRSKARTLKGVRVSDDVALGPAAGDVHMLLLEVTYAEGEPETYALPVGSLPMSDAAAVSDPRLALVRFRSHGTGEPNVLVDASADPRVAGAMLEVLLRRKKLRGQNLLLAGVAEPQLKSFAEDELPLPRALGGEQSNVVHAFGERAILKLFPKLAGESVELEVLRHLNERGAQHVPRLLGRLDLVPARGETATVAVLQSFVPNEGDAWTFTVDQVEQFFERVLMLQSELPNPPELHSGVLGRVGHEPIAEVAERIGMYLGLARLLGRRTAELHVALSTPAGNPAFEPEIFGALAKRKFYQSLRNLTTRALDVLKEQLGNLQPSALEPAREVLRRERDIRARLHRVLERNLEGQRIRVHGDYHLGQVLHTGRDVAIIDFEGEPARTPEERRRRRSPIADVAGMLRSFHYAIWGVLTPELGHHVRPEDMPALERWAPTWYGWVGSAFLESYLGTVGPAKIVPEARADLALLLDVHLLEKALYELTYELNNRPTWVSIPLRGVLDVLATTES
jgi:maltose alpha-D-glucosyltransferase/alpha-amylase